MSERNESISNRDEIEEDQKQKEEKDDEEDEDDIENGSVRKSTETAI